MARRLGRPAGAEVAFLTRKAFAAGTNSHPAIILALEAGDVETAATLVERSHSEAAEQRSAVLARSGS